MNIRELILDSPEFIKKIDAGKSISIDQLSNTAGISKDKILELFERENINIDFETNEGLSSDLLKQIILKEPETSSTPNNLSDLILASEPILKKLNEGDEWVNVIFLCRHLEMGVKRLRELFKNENIEIESSPTYKIPVELLRQIISPKDVKKDTVIESLDALALKIAKTEAKEYHQSVVLNQFIRSESIREYAKIRAQGVCELCDNPAPFNDRFGIPYLEVHHIIYLSKGGIDSVDNVAAICPNCHRKIHNLNLNSDVIKLLEKRKSTIA